MLSLAVLKSVSFFLALVKIYINRDAILNGDALWSLWRYVNQFSKYVFKFIIRFKYFPSFVPRLTYEVFSVICNHKNYRSLLNISSWQFLKSSSYRGYITHNALIK